jgi:hypothetical protein
VASQAANRAQLTGEVGVALRRVLRLREREHRDDAGEKEDRLDGVHIVEVWNLFVCVQREGVLSAAQVA